MASLPAGWLLRSGRGPRSRYLASALCAAVVLSGPLFGAPTAAGNPLSKVFFAAVHGDGVFVRRGDRSQPVAPKDTFAAEGLGIESGPGATVTMVFSNGLAVQLRGDTRIAVTRFGQEPFRPNRDDIAAEPSMSDVALNVISGTVVISTSTLAAGSRFQVQTTGAIVNIQGGTLVVTADPELTKVAVVAGTCTVYARDDSTRFHATTAGELVSLQLAPGKGGIGIALNVTHLTASELAAAETEAEAALDAKRTVYFEQKSVANEFASTTAFDSPNDPAKPRPAFNLEPVPVIPVSLPVQYTISPAYLRPQKGS